MHDSFVHPVDPIAEQKLQGAFNVIKQLNEIQERYQKLAPAERSAAAIKGLRHDADENDVILSAYVMQADPKARDQVRAAFADQQSVLHANESNRMNYMNSDASLRAVGKANAEARFDKLFARTQATLDRTVVAKPKKSVTFADQAQNKVNPGVDSKSETHPTVEKRGDLPNTTKKVPPVPPDQSLKPSHRTAPAHGTNTTFGARVPKPDVPGQRPSAKRVAEESAFAEKTVVGKIQQLQHQLNLQPKKLTNSHQ